MFYDENRIPRSFDARNQWVGSIMGARDQGWCGASWAFSTLDVYSDRFVKCPYQITKFSFERIIFF